MSLKIKRAVPALFKSNKLFYVKPPQSTYTDSCEAPFNMWENAIPLRHRLAYRANTRVDIVERTYSHPKEISPSDLTFQDINSMYSIGNDELIRIYPEGLGGKVMQLMPPGHPRSFLYRKNSFLLNVFINKLPYWKSKLSILRSLCNGRPGFIFDGLTGVGKSALMCQAVHFARSRNIVTIYIPNASIWTHGEWAWPSTLLPGFFDVPDACRHFMKMFARAHKNILKTWKLRVTPNDLPVEYGESCPSNLYELCQWAHTAPAPASIDRQSVALKYFFDEIINETERPILFVIDGMNLFCQDTHFRYPHPDFWKFLQSLSQTDIDLYPQELPRIPSSRLSFVRGINRIQHDILQKNGNDNKFLITGTTRNFKFFDGIGGFEMPENDKYANSLDEYAPFDPQKDSLLHPIKIDNFDDYEYRAFLRFLINSGELAGFGWGPLWHHSSDFERKLYKIEFLSNKNPQRVIDHYHAEITWKREYQRLRQKQYLINKYSA